MTDKLMSCPECNRHVFERDAECPFCKAALPAERRSALRAVATAAAVAMSVAAAAACGDKPTPSVPGGSGVPTVDGGAAPTPSVPGNRGDQAPAPVYGGPPP